MGDLEQFSAITLEQMQTSERYFPMAWVLWEDEHYRGFVQIVKYCIV